MGIRRSRRRWRLGDRVSPVAAEEFVAAVAGEGDLDVLAGGLADPIGGEQRGIAEGQAELLDEFDQVVGGVGIAVEDGVVDADGSGCVGCGGGLVVVRVGHADGEGLDVRAGFVCDGGHEGGVEAAGEEEAEGDVGFEAGRDRVWNQIGEVVIRRLGGTGGFRQPIGIRFGG